MAGIELIHNLAIVMLIAGVAGAVCRRLGLAPVVGYLVTGIVAGSSFLPVALISDLQHIHVLAELGVIFLMFSMGLSFNVAQLRRLGSSLIAVTAGSALLLFIICSALGAILGLGRGGSIVLAGMLMASSTTVVGSVIRMTGVSHQRFGQVALGLTRWEDLVAISMITLLGSYAYLDAVEGVRSMLGAIATLSAFVLLLTIAGLLLLPFILQRLYRTRSNELLTVLVAGLLFGVAALAVYSGYSLVLGAFILGAIIAGTRYNTQVVRAFSGVKDIFSTVFFVAIGMLANVSLLAGDWGWVLGFVLLAVLVRSAVICFMLLVVGRNPRTALRCGLTLIPLGEFTYIIALIGVMHELVPAQVYPAAVIAGLMTSVIGAILVRYNSWIVDRFSSLRLPVTLRSLQLYNRFVQHLTRVRAGSLFWKIARRRFIQIGVEILLVSSILVFSRPIYDTLVIWADNRWVTGSGLVIVYWLGVAAVLLPLIVAIWRNMSALIMIFADSLRQAGLTHPKLEPSLQLGIKTVFSVVFSLWFLSLFPDERGQYWLLLIVIFFGILMVVYGWRSMVFWHSHLEVVLETSLQREETVAQRFSDTWSEHERAWELTLDECVVPDFAQVAGKSIEELRLRQRFGATLVVIDRQGYSLTAPSARDRLFPGDRLLMLGRREQLSAARQFLQAEAEEAAPVDRLEDLGMEEVSVPKESPWLGRTLAELNLPYRAGVQLAGVQRGENRNPLPSASWQLEEGDRLLIIGTPNGVRQTRQYVESGTIE